MSVNSISLADHFRALRPAEASPAAPTVEADVIYNADQAEAVARAHQNEGNSTGGGRFKELVATRKVELKFTESLTAVPAEEDDARFKAVGRQVALADSAQTTDVGATNEPQYACYLSRHLCG